jgi:hypothetical protein
VIATRAFVWHRTLADARQKTHARLAHHSRQSILAISAQGTLSSLKLPHERHRRRIMLGNTDELRSMLCTEITKLQGGESNPARLRSIVGAASVIIKSKQLDLDFEKYAADADVRDIAPVSLSR